ncbi:hypothetical protein BJY52DRAFT_1186959 [Lactarius psammicola]|nr:hypothetical protein BJY52DRAFT_1186959 [Lactarius psammicola]
MSGLKAETRGLKLSTFDSQDSTFCRCPSLLLLLLLLLPIPWPHASCLHRRPFPPVPQSAQTACRLHAACATCAGCVPTVGCLWRSACCLSPPPTLAPAPTPHRSRRPLLAVGTPPAPPALAACRRLAVCSGLHAASRSPLPSLLPPLPIAPAAHSLPLARCLRHLRWLHADGWLSVAVCVLPLALAYPRSCPHSPSLPPPTPRHRRAACATCAGCVLTAGCLWLSARRLSLSPTLTPAPTPHRPRRPLLAVGTLPAPPALAACRWLAVCSGLHTASRPPLPPLLPLLPIAPAAHPSPSAHRLRHLCWLRADGWLSAVVCTPPLALPYRAYPHSCPHSPSLPAAAHCAHSVTSTVYTEHSRALISVSTSPLLISG